MVRDSNGYIACVTSTNVRATAMQAVPANRIGAQSVMFQAHPDNATVVYVGLEGMDPSTGVGVLGFVAGVTDPDLGPFPSLTISQPNQAAALNVADFYVQGTNGDKVCVSYTQG